MQMKTVIWSYKAIGNENRNVKRGSIIFCNEIYHLVRHIETNRPYYQYCDDGYLSDKNKRGEGWYQRW